MSRVVVLFIFSILTFMRQWVSRKARGKLSRLRSSRFSLAACLCPIADVPKFHASFARNRINATETSRSSALLNFAKFYLVNANFVRRGHDSWHEKLFLPPPVGAQTLNFCAERPPSRRCNARLIKTKYIIRVLVTCGHGAIERSASCCFCEANTYCTVSTFTF